MNSLRKTAGFALVLMLAAFALPSVAGNDKKQFSLQMNVVTVPPPTTVPYPGITLSAVITNQGNSTINSFKVSNSGLVVVGVDHPITGSATFSGSSVSVGNMHPLKSGDSLTVTFRVATCGDFDWMATAWTGSSLNGQTFNLVAPSNLHTSAACGVVTSGMFVVPNSANSCGVANGLRGIYDKDGGEPVGVPYFVTNTVPTNGQLHFRWPTSSGDVGFNGTDDPAAAFRYSVCASGPLPPLPPAPGATKVAWLNTDGTPTSAPGVPALIPAQRCIPPDDSQSPGTYGRLPAPYGRLVGSVGVPVEGNTSTITVNALAQADTIAHPVPPFDVVMATVDGDNNIVGNERMTVTQVASDSEPGCPVGAGDLCDPNERTEGDSEVETWTVTRAVLYGTTAQTHPDGLLVMSTPLPYLTGNEGSPYIPSDYNTGANAGKFVQAQMCWSARTTQGSNHSTTFIDIGDGWASEP